MSTADSPRPLPLRIAAALLISLVPFLAGCGDDYDEGDLYVWNRTDNTTDEMVVAFRLGPDGGPLTGNVLPAPIVEGDEDYIGFFEEDIYDAEADLELGGIVDFFNFFVGNDDDTVLQVF
jgi:hypothetical protein